jgi:hypothetical protein
MSECPPEFQLPPMGAARPKGAIDVVAIVSDHFRAMSAASVTPESIQRLRGEQNASSFNRLRLIALATWLLHDDFFLVRKELAGAMWKLLLQELDDLATVVRADDVVKDPVRREEFARVCLKYVGLRPKGETENQAKDRLNTLDSAERLNVVRQTRDAEARARKIREQMAAEAARAAAARYSPD